MKNTMKKILTTKLFFVLGAFFLMLLFSMGALFATRGSIQRMNEAQALHTRAVEAKRAHFEWAEGLCSALGLGTEFEGTLDYTACGLGQWLYSPEASENAEVAALVQEIIPVHQRIHETAGTLDFSGGGGKTERHLFRKNPPGYYCAGWTAG